MEQELWKIFENVNCWLRYAERKNAYLLTFIGLQLTLIKSFEVAISNWQMMVSVSMLGLCFLLAVVSFYPKTQLTRKIYFWAEGSEEQSEADNLVFYGHIKRYSIGEYISALEKRYGWTVQGKKYYEDLCGQIVANSGIATTKFGVFKMATILAVAGQGFFLWSFLA